MSDNNSAIPSMPQHLKSIHDKVLSLTTQHGELAFVMAIHASYDFDVTKTINTMESIQEHLDAYDFFKALAEEEEELNSSVSE